jgi:chromatin assembly factor 1 subunit A
VASTPQNCGSKEVTEGELAEKDTAKAAKLKEREEKKRKKDEENQRKKLEREVKLKAKEEEKRVKMEEKRAKEEEKRAKEEEKRAKEEEKRLQEEKTARVIFLPQHNSTRRRSANSSCLRVNSVSMPSSSASIPPSKGHSEKAFVLRHQ